jgi:RNA polymerase sigma-32 factor
MLMLTKSTMSWPALSSEGDLSRYLKDIQRFPVLTLEAEQALATKWTRDGDRQAAHTLVTSHLRLVVKIACQFRGYGLPIADIISEGNIGLMQAVKRFNPERGFRLATYAIWWIKATIQDFVLRSWSLVKIGTTAAQKKLFFGLRREKQRIAAYEQHHLRPDEVQHIAHRLETSEAEVIDMDRRLGGDVSLNTPLNLDGSPTELQDTLADTSMISQEEQVIHKQEAACRKRIMSKALRTLNERERSIFKSRHLNDDPPTLTAIAAKLGISRQRVQQLDEAAFKKVRDSIQLQVQKTTALGNLLHDSPHSGH